MWGQLPSPLLSLLDPGLLLRKMLSYHSGGQKTLSTVVIGKAWICLPESLRCFIAQLAILVFGIQTAAQMIQRSYYVEYTVYDCLQCLKDIF